MACSTKFLLVFAISALLACVVLAQPLQYDAAGALAKRAAGVMDINLENMPVKRKNKDDDDNNHNDKKKSGDDDDDNTATITTSSASSSKKSSSRQKNDNPDLIYDFNVKQKKTDCLSDGRVLLKKQNKKANKTKSDKKTKKN